MQFTTRSLTSNLTYFRTRRELFDDFVRALDGVADQPRINITSDQFIVIRSFLTVRNEGLNDDKRLAFDKTIMELRLLAAAQPAPQVAHGGLRGMLGL